ncbi:MAG: hypothetical protein N2038_15355 [Geminicoccaceae bacterium]|nr:hypothetical protein [Geminicoccaceae bacterium]MCX7631601.1 hypothetical protein [Geminicoccaceae bacterium]MDW8123630.1 hypothetical protein [Geminicoccaceae bacterium]
MSKRSTVLLAGTTGLLMAGAAAAGEPVRLTAEQLDEVTAGQRINLELRLSWAASTARANGAGNTSASSSTSNSASTEDILNETRNSAGVLLSQSIVARRSASSSTSASGSGTNSSASGRGYASAGDLTVFLTVNGP